jgi:LysM repeat protein
MSFTRKLILSFSILFLLAALPGFSVVPAQAAECTQYHTVKKGEYLVQIGRIYGVHWRTLADWNDLDNPSLIYPGQKLCVEMDGDGDSNGNDDGTGGKGYTGFPTISIVSVVEDESVTIQTNNMPPNDTFVVRMGEMGTQGIGGEKVDTIDSEDGGSFKATFRIPSSLEGEQRIAIRLESPDSGYFAYNWFWNDTSASDDNGSGTGGKPITGIPTFSIVSVVEDGTVTIRTNNFPADMEFQVRMNDMGTKGIGGILVATFNSGDGGSFNKTFEIPSELHGEQRIAIRTDSTTTGHFSYNWFWNNTTP